MPDIDEVTVEHANLTLITLIHFPCIYSVVFKYKYAMFILKMFLIKCLF